MFPAHSLLPNPTFNNNTNKNTIHKKTTFAAAVCNGFWWSHFYPSCRTCYCPKAVPEAILPSRALRNTRTGTEPEPGPKGVVPYGFLSIKSGNFSRSSPGNHQPPSSRDVRISQRCFVDVAIWRNLMVKAEVSVVCQAYTLWNYSSTHQMSLYTYIICIHVTVHAESYINREGYSGV